MLFYQFSDVYLLDIYALPIPITLPSYSYPSPFPLPFHLKLFPSMSISSLFRSFPSSSSFSNFPVLHFVSSLLLPCLPFSCPVSLFTQVERRYNIPTPTLLKYGCTHSQRRGWVLVKMRILCHLSQSFYVSLEIVGIMS